MDALSPWHLVLLLGIVLIVLGPGKLPETGAAIGRAIRSFQDAASGRDEQVGTAPAPMAAPGTSPTAGTGAAVAPGDPDSHGGPAGAVQAPGSTPAQRPGA